MTLTEREGEKLARECRKLPLGPDYRVNDYVKNLLNTVLDFQMDTKVVSASMHHFETNHTVRSHRKLQALVDEFADTKGGNMKLAQHMWGNNHWTRAEFLRCLLAEFDTRGIRGQASLKRWFTQVDFSEDVKGQFRSQHHSIGIALFHWLQLRLGVDTVKPDVHILNFVERAIGRRPKPVDAVDGLIKVARQLRRKAHRIDAAIWHFQRGDA